MMDEAYPYFMSNSKWYKFEETESGDGDGMVVQRFELTKKATPAAIASFAQTMVEIGPDGYFLADDLNRFQQALGYASRQYLFTENNGMTNDAWLLEHQLITYAIRSYQLLSDDVVAPNTLIFKPRIKFLYLKYLKENPKVRANDAELNQWIAARDAEFVWKYAPLLDFPVSALPLRPLTDAQLAEANRLREQNGAATVDAHRNGLK
ncbi:substrate-binding protein [Periweissella cryptocerci]|uniref:substrate-binding protein n=1 Tax=Periweissella cryptocerci TaxID=2506420 RepID=UPI001FA9A4C7|nr:substrate-binding protein [Periweissella cryptocerci]